MEMLGAILELGKTILAPISEYYKYHRSVDEHMKHLKRKRDDLECKKSDIESKMRAELLPRKKPKREVEFWLQKVKTINVEIQNTEQEAERGKYFSRMHVGKIACQKIQEVTELIDQSCGFGESLVIDPPVSYGDELPTGHVGKIACQKIQEVTELIDQSYGFSESLVIDPPVSYGDELPTGALVGEITAEITMEKIWKHLLDEDCGMIGVYGMGGVGKTTIMKQINNRLLKEKDKFNHVIWVTVSKAFDVIKLQNDIASMLHPNPLKSEDETARAGKLYVALKEMKKCVLILDDLWNAFPLENIGIPEPTSENGCKLVLTTRDAKVCHGMNCKTIKVELLSIKESRDLFLKTVGCDVSNIPEDVVEGVVKQCARLPLAIITIAGSLKNVVDVSEWRNTLNELRTSTKGLAHVDDPVFKRLQFSYERLKDKKLQDCLLCCALYPEDYEIYRDELIEHLIGEKVIESMKSRQEELDQGHTLLNKLENACLLEGGSKDFGIKHILEKRRFVKMHDLIRDMALQIAGAKFLVLEDVPNEEEWGNDVEKVSFNNNSKFFFVSPKCPKLSTLLLRGYGNIILDSFFVHLHGLRVLNVDGLNSLPNSISDLKHLTSLRLNSYRLKCVPSLAKLTALRSLDLSGGSLEEIPHGLEMLVNLRYLNVHSDDMKHKMMPPGVLPKLCQLQVLKLPFRGLKANGEEMVRLKKLECFVGAFDGVKGFNTYVESLEEGGPSHYIYVVYKKEPASQLGVAELGESVILSDCNICLLPKDVRTLLISEMQQCRLSSDYWKKSVWFKGCEEIEYINSSFDIFSLQSLDILDLHELNNLKGLFREEKVAPAPVVPLGTFSRLKQFKIEFCPNIKKLFPPRLLLDNLEQINICNCKQLEEIIGGAEASDDEVEEEEAKEIVEIFPQLRKLILWELPELKTICSSSNVILCDSLNSIDIEECPKLKRLPLSLHLIDGELSSPPSSLQIKIEKERWELLEWDNHDMKMVLEPLCQFDADEWYPRIV